MHFLLQQHQLTVQDRTARFNSFLRDLKAERHYSYHRQLLSPTGREVVIRDPYSRQARKMLLFASNNYLGLGNHPHVKKEVKRAMDQYGTGMGGPPLLCGYSYLMQEVEERLAAFKGKEAAAIFPAGFMTNLGAISALAQKEDLVIHDQLSHASIHAALQLSNTQAVRFSHNNAEHLDKVLGEHTGQFRNLFTVVEGVYSMDGDLAPLDRIVPVCRKHDAFLILDDAHGTGVLGPNGEGTAAHFGLQKEIDLVIGTFSKTFAVNGGFVAGSAEMIEYLRYFARSYIFSAALPPMTLAAVKGGLDVMQQEPERRAHLWELIDYAKQKLTPFGLSQTCHSAILPLRIPKGMDIREANRLLHEQGIFLNAIEYPAVSPNKQRFRVSLNTEHTFADIDRLAEVLEQVWQDQQCRLPAFRRA